MRAFSIFAVAALLLIAAPAAQAAAQPHERIVASGAIDVRPGERVSDIAIANGPVTMRGRTTGDLIALHGTVLIDGPVHGDVLVLSKNGVHFGPRARIGGDLTYRGTLPPGASTIVGGKTHKVNLSKAGDAFGFVTAADGWLAGTISTLLFGLLLLWLAPRAADAAFEVARSAVGPAIGWGIGLFIGLPLLGVIAVITLVGIPLGVGLLLALFRSTRSATPRVRGFSAAGRASSQAAPRPAARVPRRLGHPARGGDRAGAWRARMDRGYGLRAGRAAHGRVAVAHAAD